MEHAHSGPVEGPVGGAEVCLLHQLPASPHHAEEDLRPAGRPVLTHCNARHEDRVGAAV